VYKYSIYYLLTYLPTTVHDDALCSSRNVPSVSRRHSLHHRWQPDTIWSALCRQHTVSATNDIYPWASVHSPTPAHLHRMFCLQHFVITYTSENYSKHTSLIQDLSLVFICNMCLDMYVRQAVELCCIIIIIILITLRF